MFITFWILFYYVSLTYCNIVLLKITYVLLLLILLLLILGLIWHSAFFWNWFLLTPISNPCIREVYIFKSVFIELEQTVIKCTTTKCIIPFLISNQSRKERNHTQILLGTEYHSLASFSEDEGIVQDRSPYTRATYIRRKETTLERMGEGWQKKWKLSDCVWERDRKSTRAIKWR